MKTDPYLVDLLPPQLHGVAAARRGRLLHAALMLLSMLVFLAYSGFLISYRLVKTELAEAEQQLAALRPAAESVRSVKDQQVKLERELWAYRRQLAVTRELTPLLQELGRITPSDIWLSELQISEPAGKSGNGVRTDRREVVLQGYAEDLASVGVMLNKLQQLPEITDVSFGGATYDQWGLKFELSCVFGGET